MKRELVTIFAYNLNNANILDDYYVNHKKDKPKNPGRPEEVEREVWEQMTKAASDSGILNLVRVLNLMYSNGWELLPITLEDDTIIFWRWVEDSVKTY